MRKMNAATAKMRTHIHTRYPPTTSKSSMILATVHLLAFSAPSKHFCLPLLFMAQAETQMFATFVMILGMVVAPKSEHSTIIATTVFVHHTLRVTLGTLLAVHVILLSKIKPVHIISYDFHMMYSMHSLLLLLYHIVYSCK